MKDASSIPPDFNPNYEEQRESYLPIQQRRPTRKTSKPAPHRNNVHQSPEGRAANEERAMPPNEPEDHVSD